MDEKTGIKYTGPSVHRRILTPKDFEAAGFSIDKPQEWSSANNHTVDASEWPEGAFEFVTSLDNFEPV